MADNWTGATVTSGAHCGRMTGYPEVIVENKAFALTTGLVSVMDITTAHEDQ